MKFRITLKDPDGIYESISSAAMDEARRVADLAGGVLTVAEMTEKVRDHINEKVGRFFRYGDYVDLDVDTEAGTVVAVVDR